MLSVADPRELAREASESDESFATPAMRALVLYPMNALVNDSSGGYGCCSAIRGLGIAFGSGRYGRRVFARYTSRTLYPGVRTEKKDSHPNSGHSSATTFSNRGSPPTPSIRTSRERSASSRRYRLEASGRAKPKKNRKISPRGSDVRDLAGATGRAASSSAPS